MATLPPGTVRARRDPSTKILAGDPTIMSNDSLQTDEPVDRSETTLPRGRVPRVGVLSGGTPGDPNTAPHIEAFRAGLREHGYAEGENLVVEYRYAEGSLQKLPGLLADLVGIPVDIIVATGPPTIRAAKQATTTIPIVMTGHSDDPVGLGFVASLERPGGNVTGLANPHAALSGKRLELLQQAFPGIGRVGVLWHPADSLHPRELNETETAAHALGVHIVPLRVDGAEEIPSVFDAVADERIDGLVVLHSNFFFAHREELLQRVADRKLPAMYGFRPWVEVGGLMAYGAPLTELYWRAAGYVDKILHGARPAELAVEQPSRFTLVLNTRTAQSLGNPVSPAILATAELIK
jgi:putative ABC transport system substrate-binding protein